MQFIKSTILLGFAALAFANDCDNGTCSGTATVTSTAANGAVFTIVSTTTGVVKSTTLVPLYTQSVATSTVTGVDGSKLTLSYTTDIGTTPTNTQYATTTDVNLQSGYALTTVNGVTSYVYTGTGTAPSLTVVPKSVISSLKASSTGNGAAATAMPFFGAAALAGGLAYVL